jgi:copper chaperone NosL
MKSQARLSRTSTIAMWASAVMLIGVFVFPLWVIGLEAPQYPQGLGLNIWINRIEGKTPHDLQNINGLNHYIGMQKIEPESIPELHYMKYFAFALVAFAVLVAWARRRWLLVTWTAVALALAGAGLYDFWKWEYSYGHNLDPAAAIKLPGMSFQPPLFGAKQLANFRATSWPGIGGMLAMVAVGLALLSAAYEIGFRRRLRLERETRSPLRTPVKAAAGRIALGLMLWMSAGCASKLPSIAYGTDVCDYCGMTISDNRFGAAVVTTKGRAYKFDSVECMLQSVLAGEKLGEVEVKSWYATNYTNRGSLVDASEAAYLVSPNLPSPMGANLAAFATKDEAAKIQQEKGGDIMDWEATDHYVRNWR